MDAEYARVESDFDEVRCTKEGCGANIDAHAQQRAGASDESMKGATLGKCNLSALEEGTSCGTTRSCKMSMYNYTSWSSI